MFLALLTATLLASAEPAAQAGLEPAAASAAAPAPAQAKPEARRVKMVCRSETTTGTRFAKKVCMPLDEFERRAKVSQETMVEMQRNLNTTFGKGN